MMGGGGGPRQAPAPGLHHISILYVTSVRISSSSSSNNNDIT